MIEDWTRAEGRGQREKKQIFMNVPLDRHSSWKRSNDIDCMLIKNGSFPHQQVEDIAINVNSIWL